MKLLKEKLLSDKENDIQKFKEEISHYLTQEIITRFHNNYGRINTRLKKDMDIDTSLTLLKNKAEFESLLLPK
jgi:carboxyl-terminal processing protease